MQGIHLIGDFSDCLENTRLINLVNFQALCLKYVEESRLTSLNYIFHQFDEGGFTGAIVLAESHLAIHTWPEKNGFTLDVYVCNYSQDNTIKAKCLFNLVVDYFNPINRIIQEITRS
jgi:spermidine synthase